MICLAAALVSGCNTFGVVANDIGGTPEVAAKWTPSKAPTLVLVDYYSTSPNGDLECDRIGQYLMDDLAQNNVVPVLDFSRLTSLRDRVGESYRKMSIAAIGRAVGAKQVIYVNLRSLYSDVVMGSDTVKWRAAANVTVVDATTGKSLWPIDLAGGHPIAAETDYIPGNANHDDILARDGLDRNVARQVGDLFHNWVRSSDSMLDTSNMDSDEYAPPNQ